MSNPTGEELARELGIDPAELEDLKYHFDDLSFQSDRLVLIWADADIGDEQVTAVSTSRHITEIFPGRHPEVDACMRAVAVAVEQLLDAVHDASDLGRPAPKSRMPFR